MTEQHCVYVGVDAGGTHTRIRYRLGHTSEEGTLEAPGVNPQVHGTEETAHRITEWLKQVEQITSLPICGVCIGLAGARNERLKRQIFNHLYRLYPASTSISIRLLDDALLTLEAAFPDASGILLITGTGSSLIARSIDGQIYRSGGWGYLLGDEGGGYRLGLAVLQALADMLDGGPTTDLYRTFSEAYGPPTRDQLIEQVYHQQFPIPSLAPLLLNTAAAGDAHAARIVTEQVQALLNRLDWLWQRIRLTTRAAIALWGGLLNHPYYRTTLESSLTTRLPELNVYPVRQQPVERAVELAQQLSR